MGFCFHSSFFFSTTSMVSRTCFESLDSHWMVDLMEDSRFTFVMIELGL